MKKQYINPAIQVFTLHAADTIMAGSIQATVSEETYDGEAGSRQSTSFDIWGDDEED